MCSSDLIILLIMFLIFINQIVIILTERKVFTYIIFTFIILSCLLKKNNSINQLFIFLFLPDKYLQVIGCVFFTIIICIRNPRIIKQTILAKDTFEYLFFAFGAALINCIDGSGNFIVGLIQWCVYILIFILIKYSKEFTKCINIKLLDYFFIIEIITGISQFFILHEKFDAITGTLYSAHWYGAFIITYGYCKFCMTKYKKNFILYLLIISFMLYLCDAKHVYLCFFVALSVNWLLKLFKIKKKILFSWITISIFIGILVFIFTVIENKGSSNNALIKAYVLNPLYNKKYVFFKNTFKELLSYHGLIGNGVGFYGSQICLTMAKGIIYSWQNISSFFTIAAEPYKVAINGVMTQWYVETGISISSMVLGYPLVSIIALIAENGFIGLILLSKAIENLMGEYKDATLFIMLFILCFFDTYFEIPCITVLIIIYQCIISNYYKDNINCIRTSKSYIYK